jgi:antirestriction protein ArdC
VRGDHRWVFWPQHLARWRACVLLACARSRAGAYARIVRGPEAYYGVLFHECVHSTGHSSRLDRFGKTGEPARFGDADYSREELVAELGSYFLAAEAGIGAPIQENQAAYLGSWLRVLKADPKVLIGSAAAAQKAVDLILGRT